MGACDSQPTTPLEGGQIALPVPAAIRQIATLNSLPLEIQISVNNEIVRVVPVGNPDELTTTIVNVPINQNNEIKLAWFAIVGTEKVLLAERSELVPAGRTELNINNYNSTGPEFDADGDGRFNLSEARENRNLLSAIDLEVPFQTAFGGAFANLNSDGIDPDTSGEIGEDDEPTAFSLRHDGSSLIVYVCGKDKTLQGDSLDTNGQYWHDDTVFIYLDGADSDNDSFDGIDDFQIGFIRSTGEMRVSEGGNGQFCPGGACITHSFYNTSTLCEYELSVNLPLADFNMTIGSPIGFDIEITDDDNGGLREGSSAWIGFDDRSDQKPSTFGTINLN